MDRSFQKQAYFRKWWFFFLKSLKIIKLEHLNKLFFGYTIIISLDDEAHREVYSHDKSHFQTAAASIESSSHSFSHPKATMRCVTIRNNGLIQWVPIEYLKKAAKSVQQMHWAQNLSFQNLKLLGNIQLNIRY